MTNIALPTSLVNNIHQHILEHYDNVDVPKIIKLVSTSTEEEFNLMLNTMLKEHLGNNEAELKTKNYRTDFIEDIFRANTISVVALTPYNTEVYYAGGYKEVNEREAELLKEFGVTVAKVKQVSKSESWITMFWSI
jgi:hypothetical protein